MYQRRNEHHHVPLSLSVPFLSLSLSLPYADSLNMTPSSAANLYILGKGSSGVSGSRTYGIN